jgi:hypothetical protein
MIIGQLSALPASGDADNTARKVDTLNRGLDEAREPQECADGQGTVSYVQGAGADLEQQWCQDEIIISTHENDLDIPAAIAELLQMASGVSAAETAAKDHDPSVPIRRVGSRCCTIAARNVCMTQGIAPASETRVALKKTRASERDSLMVLSIPHPDLSPLFS